MIPITVMRDGKQSSLVAPLQFTWHVQLRIAPLPVRRRRRCGYAAGSSRHDGATG